MSAAHKVYVLTDPRTGATRYVGYTGSTLKLRLSGHLREAKTSHQCHRCRWIRGLQRLRLVPVITEIESFDDKTIALGREVYWIARLRKTEKLTNIAPGGWGWTHDEASRKNISEKTKQAIAEGRGLRSHSKESREKMRQSMLGKKFTDERRLAVSALQKGRIHSDEQNLHVAEGVQRRQEAIKRGEEPPRIIDAWPLARKIAYLRKWGRWNEKEQREMTNKEVRDSNKARKQQEAT